MNKDLYDVSLEPWITVESLDGTLSQVGFQELLIQASNYRRIVSETPTQESAILRQCLAITHYLISKYEFDGTEQGIEDLKEALDRWDTYWKEGKFPKNIIIQYFNQNRSIFNLIDEKAPFMQVPMAKRGTYYKASKIVEAESSNKSRLFSMRSGSEKETISLAEGAAWLYTIIGFDDTSVKPSKQGKRHAEEYGIEFSSPGCGWLGKIGAIYPQGKNLFETILLNLPLIDEQEEVWPPDRFCWNSPQERWRERHPISEPESFSELMTLYSRFLLFDLDKENGRIKGYWLLGGEFFDKENCKEPFTLWKPVKVKVGETGGFTPKRHTETRQAWRSFSEILNPTKRDQATRQPGIIQWIKKLKEENLLPSNYIIHFEMPFVSYGDKDFYITNTSTQSLEFYPSLLTDLGENWRKEVESQIEKLDKLASYTGFFFQNLAQIQGCSKEASKSYWVQGCEKLYEKVDEPFLEWISSLNLKEENSNDFSLKKEKWEKTAQEIAFQILHTQMSYLQDRKLDGLIGKTIRNKEEEKIISVFEVERSYFRQVNKLYPDIKER